MKYKINDVLEERPENDDQQQSDNSVKPLNDQKSELSEKLKKEIQEIEKN
ncbi:hypothetical protein GSH19_05115 [Lactobacillus sp. S2-2]|nr:hypothetical protein [Lactobacillus sp. S2-2]MCF6515532.1 hypothetical protein [Lactobacillus sp. S2-2]